MTLYETIFARRSVRQYDQVALDASALEEIAGYADSVQQLPGHSARFDIVESAKLKGSLAPYAILAHADDGDEALVNIGYTLQIVDLWLQGNGYGSVWCGMAKPQNPEHDFRILLGFGKTSIPLRKGEDDFKRKKLSEVSHTNNAIARAVRVAPSAVNFQPWKLEFSDSKVTIAANVRGVGKLLPGRMFLFDLGIALRHAELALQHDGKTVAAIVFHNKGKNIAVAVDYR